MVVKEMHVGVTPTSRTLIISIHNPSCVQESVVEIIKKNVFSRCLVNNLGLIHNGVGMVDGNHGMPRAGSHYNLGTSRGPDKIGSRAGPGPRAVSCTWLVFT